MRNPIIFGKFNFPTKKALTEYIQQLIANCGGDFPLCNEDRHFFTELIRHRHPDGDAKLSKPISAMYTYLTPQSNYQHRGIKIVYVDGAEDDFAWTLCVRSPRPDQAHHIHVVQAARNTIRGQILNFRRLNPPDKDWYHVDHVYPFHLLFSDWLASEGLGEEDVLIPEDRGLVNIDYVFSDAILGTSWYIYHAAFAQLQYLTPLQNMSKGGSI